MCAGIEPAYADQKNKVKMMIAIVTLQKLTAIFYNLKL